MTDVTHFLVDYANDVRRIRKQKGMDNEPALYASLKTLLQSCFNELTTDQAIIVDQFPQISSGSPDYVVSSQYSSQYTRPVGYVEAKAVGEELNNPKGRNRRQKDRYLHDLSTWIYTNYHDFILFHRGEQIASISAFSTTQLDPKATGTIHPEDISTENAQKFSDLLNRFLALSPTVISSYPELTEEVARAARSIRTTVHNRVTECMDNEEYDNPLVQLYEDYRTILYSSLSVDDFADTAAQTLAYGTLLAHLAQPDLFTNRLSDLPEHIDHDAHRLLRETLQLFDNSTVKQEIGWSIEALVSVVKRSKYSALTQSAKSEPLLYFYEDFLKIYDPEKRKSLGVYFTPEYVVQFQVKAIHSLLQSRFDRSLGIADEGIDMLDPSSGTGTYLFYSIKEGLAHVKKRIQGNIAKSAIKRLFDQLRGFELMIGPYTVAHWRIASYARYLKVKPVKRVQVYLTDTLDPSHVEPAGKPHVGFFAQPLQEERRESDEIKEKTPIMVIMGNPPWKRGKKPDPNFHSEGRNVNWIAGYLLQSFKSGLPPEYSQHLKNLQDPYIFFYRWSLWKLMEQENAPRNGILSFISSRSFLRGEAFAGMRRELRKYFDEIYILDLQGDGRSALPAGVKRDDNVFAGSDVQRGCAITICIADGSHGDQEAKVYYECRWGSRKDKFRFLKDKAVDEILSLDTPIDRSGIEPFLPRLESSFRDWPNLTELFGYFCSGIQVKRKLPIGFSKSHLQAKLEEFESTTDPIRRAELFEDRRERSARDVHLDEISQQPMIRYSYRPLDRRWLYNHDDLVAYRRKKLQKVWGPSNLALYTLKREHGEGPTALLAPHLPDMNSFRGSSSGYAFPLWDNRRNPLEEGFIPDQDTNLNQRVLRNLGEEYGENVRPYELFAYCFAILFCRSYSMEFATELRQSMPNIPFTIDYELFQTVVNLGNNLIELHSFSTDYPSERFSAIIEEAPDSSQGPVIEFAQHQSDRLYLSEQSYVTPVSEPAWDFSVSGYPILKRWIDRRKGLQIDFDLVNELLQVVWILEESIAMEADLATAFKKVIEGECISRERLLN